MGGLSQKGIRLIIETLSHHLRSVGTIFALLKKRMPVKRGIRLYQLSNSGIKQVCHIELYIPHPNLLYPHIF
jgi:hypothetical protein